MRSAAAPSPVRFSDFSSRAAPRAALRLLADVDIFFLAELLFADFGGVAGARPRIDVGASPVLVSDFDVGRERG